MEVFDLVQQLVASDSVSIGNQSSTRPIADTISTFCQDAGCDVSQYVYTSEGKEKVNVVATKGGGAPLLALSGHMDTVGYTPEWQSDPFTVTEYNERLHGLGIADMKLFLATAIKAVEMTKIKDIVQPVALYFTSDEEVGCIGAKDLARTSGFDLAKFVVIGEPTELVPVNLHKGYLYFRVAVWRQLRDKEKEKVRNRKVTHSSEDRFSTNVVETAMPVVIQALSEFRHQMRRRYQDERFAPPYPTMNIGGVVRMDSQAAKNIIPGEFTLDNEIRLLPGQNPQDILAYLQRTLDTALSCLKLEVRDEVIHASVNPVRQPTPPMSTVWESELVKTTVRLSNGKGPQSVSYNTEGGVYNRSGADTVIWGPGSIAQAHKANEFVDRSWLRPEVAGSYAKLIQHFCCERRM